MKSWSSVIPFSPSGNYARLIRYILPQWRMLLAISGLTVLSSAVSALQPWPMKLLVDYAIQREPLPAALESIFVSFSAIHSPGTLVAAAALTSVALFAINSGIESGLTWAWALAGQRMVYSLSTDLFSKLQRLSFGYHNRHTPGDSLSRLTGDTWCAYTLTGSLFSPLQQVLTLAGIGLLAWRLNPELAAISLLTAPALAVSSLYFGDRLKLRAKLGREAESRLLSFVHQTLSAIPVVQSFTSETRNDHRFRNLAANAVAFSQRGIILNSYYGLVNGLIITAGTCTVLYWGGLQVLSGRLTVGSLIVFAAYMRTLQSAAEGLLKTYGNLKPVEASFERVCEVLDLQDGEMLQAANPEVLSHTRGHVRLERVTFGYEPGRPVLKDVSVEARPGETVALIGATGAGKSTLVSLIPRFFDPWEGSVTLDGLDLRRIGLASLRAQIALVPQEPFLFPISVAENIAYGRLDASREEIIAAAVSANADAFIRLLPNGYDTVLGQRGATLSGGERQRLSIARALVRNAPVLIMDEPTSALDAQTEALVFEALERLMEGRTSFVIAHRLSTIRRADRIFVLERGEVVETGTHRELMLSGGAYSRFHSIQSETPEHEVVV